MPSGGCVPPHQWFWESFFFVLVFNGKIDEHIFTSFPIHIQYLCRWEKEWSSKLANTAGWQHTIQRSAGSLGHMGDSWDTNQRESRFWVYLVQDESILHCTISMWWSYFKSGDSNNISVGCFTVAAGSLSTFPHSALGLLDNPEQSFSSPSHLQKTLCNPSFCANATNLPGMQVLRGLSSPKFMSEAGHLSIYAG